jgi:hypothetical protein
VSSVGSNWRQAGAADPAQADIAAGQVLPASNAEFLSGDWTVLRRIRDHRSGQTGSFRGEASFRPCAARSVRQAGRTSGPAAGDADDRVLAYHEHGELQFGGHRGPASRSLLYRELADGSADVRFADGREFYRLDLRRGTWRAGHPCRADTYQVSVTRHGADSFTETWHVAGPDKDYELITTYTRTGARE